MDQPVPTSSRPHLRFIDLAIIAVIIVLIFTLGMIVFSRVWNAAEATQCKCSLKMLGTAIKVHESQNKCLPFVEQKMVEWPDGPQINVEVSLFYQLLSCVDAGDVEKLPYYYAPAGTVSVASTKLSFLQCASDPGIHQPATVRQGPDGSIDCPVATSNYVLNRAIFRGSRTSPLTSNEAMEAQSSTIIAGERLQFCTVDSSGKPKPQVWWADPTVTMFWVAGVDNTGSGKPIETIPPGMEVQTATGYRSCRLPPPVGESMPAGTYFQSVHYFQVNVLRGDAGVTQIHSDFDQRSLNYFSLGVGRAQWNEMFMRPNSCEP